ncbi:hypothetical protein [Paraburkholderia sp. RAU2J]|uniref:hypothetical protein n=1 Tax=Paraburkholderia sp. RAU2J TaxID=1938810 RepID=UPI0032202643
MHDANGATVHGVDPAMRTVTLTTRSGKVMELEVTNEARNFDQLALGDVVTAQYRESLTLSLLDEKAQASRRPCAAWSEARRRTRPRSDDPRGCRRRQPAREDRDVARPRGEMVDLHMQDPERLRRIKKGNQVKAVYTEALAISVEPASTK